MRSVPKLVPKEIIGLFEIVQIDEHHGQAMSLTLRPEQGVRRQLLEQGPVG